MFGGYTNTKIKQHNLQAVKKCFAIADNIYSRGNDLVRGAMENVFVYSFSTLLNFGNEEEKIKLESLLPLSLYSAYVKQVLRSGI